MNKRWAWALAVCCFAPLQSARAGEREMQPSVLFSMRDLRGAQRSALGAGLTLGGRYDLLDGLGVAGQVDVGQFSVVDADLPWAPGQLHRFASRTWTLAALVALTLPPSVAPSLGDEWVPRLAVGIGLSCEQRSTGYRLYRNALVSPMKASWHAFPRAVVQAGVDARLLQQGAMGVQVGAALGGHGGSLLTLELSAGLTATYFFYPG